MIRADLHVHTYYSDGVQSPAEVVNAAARAGLDMIAVTDHDTAAAYGEFSAQAEKRGIYPVRGVEISAYHNGIKLHTLGYGLDFDSPPVKEFLERLYKGAQRRAEDMLSKLAQNGVKLSMEEVDLCRYSKAAPIHSMHVARAAAKKGYANGNPYNFYMQYLAEGKCANSMLCRPTPEETVRVIKAGGGISSIAHPGRVMMPESDFAALAARLKQAGLNGIEAVYSTHTVRQTAYYSDLASSLGLFVTGGSDCHYPEGNKKVGFPQFYPSEELIERLKR